MRATVCRSGVIAATALVLSACGSEDVTDRGFTVRDSAGVTIVEVLGPPSAYAPIGHVLQEPSLVLGSVADDTTQMFGSIADLRRTDNGSILVADAQAAGIRVFDSAGEYQRTLGGPGDGPGELSRGARIARISGDSIWIRQGGTRVTTLMLDGRLVSVVTIPRREGMLPTAAYVLDDHHLIVESSARDVRAWEPDEDFRLRRDEILLAHHRPDGELLDAVASFSGPEWAGQRMGAIGGPDATPFEVRLELPFARGASFAVLPTKVVGGPNDLFVLRSWRSDGSLEAMIRFPGLDRALTNDDVRARRERLIGEAENAGRRTETIERSFDEFPIPETWPAFGDILPGDEGYWVLESGPNPTPSRWWFFSSETHEPAGYIDAPPDLEVYEIGADFVLGVGTDELDVDYVRMYELTRTAS